MITLAIEASTYTGSVAVIDDDRLLAEADVRMRGADEERLMPAVLSTLGAAGVALDRLGRIACGAGPGSFTSLRIAASIAKGLAVGTGAPLHAVSSLALLVASRPRPAGRYVPVLDAMRGEWYAAVFDVDSDGPHATSVVREGVSARVMSAADVRRLVLDHAAVLLGATDDGESPATLRVAADSDRPHARGVSGTRSLLTPVDLASWEPHYGRLAEAQVKWEAAHGRALGA